MSSSSRNKTIEVKDIAKEKYLEKIITDDLKFNSIKEISNRTINGDSFQYINELPEKSFDLIFADPPYNLDKYFRNDRFSSMEIDEYQKWTREWLVPCLDLLKPDGSIYVCGDWRSSPAIFNVLNEEVHIRNRITWKREKGRGAKNNWKNSSEDIWFATKSEDYTFNVEDVKKRKEVIAPYTDDEGNKKDWGEINGEDIRLTHPSNIWTEMTVPFWSMPENTEHPTQKPEKLVAKVILASSNEGDLVFDPFLGAGTTSVVCEKLDRNYIGIESDLDYCLLAEKRLEMAKEDPGIQGYLGGFFWPRNSSQEQKKFKKYLEEKSDDGSEKQKELI